MVGSVVPPPKQIVGPETKVEEEVFGEAAVRVRPGPPPPPLGPIKGVLRVRGLQRRRPRLRDGALAARASRCTETTPRSVIRVIILS